MRKIILIPKIVADAMQFSEPATGKPWDMADIQAALVNGDSVELMPFKAHP